jgi:hypothetical protein
MTLLTDAFSGIALVSYVLILGITVSAYFLTGLGMGRDMWTIPGPDVLTWSKVSV